MTGPSADVSPGGGMRPDRGGSGGTTVRDGSGAIHESRLGALRPSLIYLLLGVVWILASDRVLAGLVEDQGLLTAFQTLKGWAFVVISALVIYTLVRHEIGRIHKAEVRFRSLVDHAFAGVCVIQDGRLVYVNSRLTEILGTTAEELLAVEDIRDLAVEEHRVLLDEAMAPNRRLLATPTSFPSRRMRVLRRDGTECPVEVAAGPVDWHGCAGMIAMVLDRSEQERLEEQFRHSQKMEAIGQLTGSVAHDFNNILTAAGVPIELVLQDMEEGDPRRTDLEEAYGAVERATQLSRQLLTFSRRRVVRPRPVDLNATLRDLMRMLGRLVGDDVQLVSEPGDLNGYVFIAPSHVEQIFANLVVNAREAMPDGGKVTIRTFVVPGDPDSLRHREGLRPGRHAVLEVQDTGQGISEEAKRRMFEPFFTTKEQGTGLGLSTVFGIVRQADGFIRVESEPGRGTSMQVYLPLRDAPEDREALGTPREEVVAASTTSPAPSERPEGARTVLVVDDDEAVQRAMDRVLSRAGFSVLRADRPGEALRLAVEHDGAIDVLVTDIMLPEMDGIAFAAAFKEHRPETPVLYASGYSNDAITQRFRYDRTLPFIEKPFHVKELVARVREMLPESRTSTERPP